MFDCSLFVRKQIVTLSPEFGEAGQEERRGKLPWAWSSGTRGSKAELFN